MFERHHNNGHVVDAAIDGDVANARQVQKDLPGEVVPLEAVVVVDAEQDHGAPSLEILFGYVGTAVRIGWG